MTNDLVEKLRALHVWPQVVADDHADLLTPRRIDKLYEVGRVSHEAADLIETQAREIERLRGALEQIAQADYGYTDIIESGAPPEKHADYFCSMVTWRQRTARAALAGDSHDQ